MYARRSQGLREAAFTARPHHTNSQTALLISGELFLHSHDHGRWMFNFDNQFGIMLMPEFYHDSIGRVVHVPKHPLPVMVKRPCCKDARNIGPAHAQSFPPSLADFWIGVDADHIRKWDRKMTAQGPQLVPARYFNVQLAVRHAQFSHYE